MLLATVVVTFNRRDLLEICLQAIANQTRPADLLFVVDNASTDGTSAWLRDWLPANIPYAKLVLMPDNQGGAGGFSRGLSEAVEAGADWVWMMDDDARPHKTALEELLQTSLDPNNVYGSLAVNGSDTAWATTLEDQNNRVVHKVADVPAQARVTSLPFLGFLIHRSLVSRIGLPEAAFFILADDTEYCLRARAAGAQIVIVGTSHIEHPKSEPYVVTLPFRRLICLRLAPWKRYYDTRNRIFIARRYYGARLYSQTIPAIFIRLMTTLIYEPDRWRQIKAYSAGLADGLLGRDGCRHGQWGIEP